LLFGGQSVGTWSFRPGSPSEWRRLNVGSVEPTGIFSPAGIYDPRRNRVLLWGGYDGTTKNELWQLTWDKPTAVAIALVHSETQAGRVLLEWQIRGALPGSGGGIMRRTRETDWADVRRVEADVTWRVRFVDDNVVDGETYGYRLILKGVDGDVTSEEAWVEIPIPAILGLQGFSPNPASSELRVAFSLPSAKPARIEVLDVSGRTVLSRDLGAPAPGSHVESLEPSGKLPAGVYWVRLTQGSRSRTVKGVVVR
jgi:hypothetical protein